MGRVEPESNSERYNAAGGGNCYIADRIDQVLLTNINAGFDEEPYYVVVILRCDNEINEIVKK